ncbi:zinc finger protein 610 [Drosophila sulfurigaster albostrigata]|uniref:zinc finger protein 610 n=1 Tax=Drosophila sulfurigaster albostrigata TaxID=89887 RepID=UPI002D21EA73|nr:zinc finger protein 610 [Drosophila sulfurigaster albostrigata]
MLPQKIPAKLTPITVPVFELPQIVVVDTVIISEKFARDNNISVSATISKSLANKMQISKTDDAHNIQPARATSSNANHPVVTAKQMIDRAVMTLPAENSLPTRCREMQTDLKTTVDVAIQCERDLTDEWELAFEKPATTASEAEEERKFLKLVSENTNIFPNGMLECRICGEIASLLQEHQSHLAVHWAPRALCTACGKMVRNEFYMSQHNLICPARPAKSKKTKRSFKCPHLQCSVMWSSRSELAKHIEQHSNENLYGCQQCRKRFSTMASFVLHRLLNAACCNAKLFNLSKQWSRYSRKAAAKRCTICSRQFGSSASAAWHKRRCMMAYQQRLLKFFKK